MIKRRITEKVSVTLPKDLVTRIRSIAVQGEVSSFFTEALEYYMAFQKQRSALEKGFGAWRDKNHPELASPQSSVEYIRRTRKSDNQRLERLKGAGGG
jgi:hypothetical protein